MTLDKVVYMRVSAFIFRCGTANLLQYDLAIDAKRFPADYCELVSFFFIGAGFCCETVLMPVSFIIPLNEKIMLQTFSP